MLLMRIEFDFLLDKRVFIKPQQLYIRCRLNKKVRAFLSSEFTILQDTAYIVGTIAASSNNWNSLVRIQPQTCDKHLSYENTTTTKTMLKSGPSGIRTRVEGVTVLIILYGY
jgi:hypothetical protein